MEIKKQIITEVRIDEHSKLETGDTVKFIANNSCYLGEYEGMTNRGCLKFKGTVGKATIHFNIMPKSIKNIEIVERG